MIYLKWALLAMATLFVCAGKTIALTYTVAPTWTWFGL